MADSPLAGEDTQTIAGAILAGGAGRRMGGQDKAWLEWRGKPLVEHVRARFAPQVPRLLVSANRHVDYYRSWPCPIVPDDLLLAPAGAGPLLGMRSIMAGAVADWFVFVPCDAPLLPLDLVSSLWASIGSAKAAVAVANGRWQPVFCAMHQSLAPLLGEFLEGGGRSPERFLQSVDAVGVMFKDAQAFHNVNELQQLE